MSMASLSGPRLAPASGRATELVVLLHGYGADGDDLIGLASHWQQLLPGAAFVAPHAPTRVPGAPSGFQWFPISRIDPHEMQNGVAMAAPGIAQFLDEELDRLGLPPDRLALAGFSQGAMLSLHLGLNRAVAPAAIVGFSGLLAGPPPAQGHKPPILLTHGDADQVIPVGALFAAVGALGLAGLPLQWHLAPGMGHGIDPEGLDLAGTFLALAFAGRLKSDGPFSTPVTRPSHP
jgi:phospholipase/carboxylesterase